MVRARRCPMHRRTSGPLQLLRQSGDELRRRERPSERRALPGPVRAIARLAGGATGAVECPTPVVSDRLGWDIPVSTGRCECAEPIGQTPGAPTPTHAVPG